MNKSGRIVLILVVVSVALLSLTTVNRPNSQLGMLGVSSVRAEEESCSVASLHGTYAVHAQGTFVEQLSPSLPAPPFPFGEAGIATLDGAGHLSGKSTVNLGGVVLQPTFTGTYTVNPDCTGTMLFTVSTGVVLHDAIVVTGRGTQNTQTDPFAVASRTLERTQH